MKLTRFYCVIATVLFLFFAKNIYSQEFHGGITLGGVTSQVAGDNYAGFHKIGFTGGFWVNHDLGTHSKIQMELTFSQKGSRFSPDENSDKYQYLLRFSTINLPVIYQYRVLRFVFEGGVNFDFLVHHFEEANYSEILEDEWKFVTLSSLFGVRYLVSEKFSIGVRTINSINSIRKNTVPNNVQRYGKRFGEYNDVLQLSLFYEF